MRLRLYRYDGRRNVMNKLDSSAITTLYDSGNLDPVDFGNIIRSEFDPTGASFVLSELVGPANYCVYDFNGVTWCGYTDVSADAYELYRYTVTIDPLTTAYYAGCMAVDAQIARTQTPSIIFDSERPLSPRSVLLESSDDIDWSNYCIIANCANLVAASAPLLQGAQSFQTPSCTDVLIFPNAFNNSPFGNFRAFLRAASAAISSSNNLDLSFIQSVYVAPSAPLFPGDYSLISSLVVEYPPENLFEHLAGRTLTIPSSSYSWAAYRMYNANPNECTVAVPISAAMQSSSARAGNWTLHIPMIGEIRINPAIIPEDATYLLAIVSLNVSGVFLSFNVGWARGNYWQQPTEVWYSDDVISVPLKEMISFPTGKGDNSALTKMLGTAITSIAAAVVTENPVPLITGGMSIAGDVYGMATANNTRYAGNDGGMPERNLRRYNNTTLTVEYYPYADEAVPRFPGIKGYPSNRTMTISSSPAGYLRTVDAQLAANGLPIEIIEAAQQALNDGVYKE